MTNLTQVCYSNSCSQLPRLVAVDGLRRVPMPLCAHHARFWYGQGRDLHWFPAGVDDAAPLTHDEILAAIK